MGLLQGKRALITGGTTGLGLAVAERYLTEGARVVITGRDLELGEQATGLYSVTKAAVVMLGKMLALDGGQDGVRSNVLCPGDIWPGMRHMAPPGEQERAESGEAWPVPPIGRIGQADDVAAAAVF